MNAKDHFWYGLFGEILGGGLIYYYFPYTLSWYILIIAIVSPLLPDLDHREGKLREVSVLVGILLNIFGIYLKNWNLIIYAFIIFFFGFLIYYTTHHRGYLHRYSTGIILFVGISFILQWQIVAIGLIGYYSHLWLDR